MNKSTYILSIVALAAMTTGIVMQIATYCLPKARYERAEPKVFFDEIRLPTTPVKDQTGSQLCWVYAMLAAIETEHIMQDDSVHLSVDYVARMELTERTMMWWHALGQVNKVLSRGMPQDALRTMSRYGAMLYDAYHNDGVNYLRLEKHLAWLSNHYNERREEQQFIEKTFDEEVGPLPPAVHFMGEEYTPQEMGHSLFREGDYVAVTSFMHHPYGMSFELEVTDNLAFNHNEYMNVDIDMFMLLIEQSLRNGHPVVWHGDVSEPFFLFRQGVAELSPDRKCSPVRRQKLFEWLKTTDDHSMELVGIAHDENGKRYYIAKNSWGTNNAYGGFMYLSENYVRCKTVGIVMRTELFDKIYNKLEISYSV